MVFLCRLSNVTEVAMSSSEHELSFSLSTHLKIRACLLMKCFVHCLFAFQKQLHLRCKKGQVTTNLAQSRVLCTKTWIFLPSQMQVDFEENLIARATFARALHEHRDIRDLPPRIVTNDTSISSDKSKNDRFSDILFPSQCFQVVRGTDALECCSVLGRKLNNGTSSEEASSS